MVTLPTLKGIPRSKTFKIQKNTNMKLLLNIFLVLLIAPQSYAQNQDYIIDINDRKIFGNIKLNTPAINSVQIKFKDNKGGGFQQYRTNQIKTWCVGNQVYETKAYKVNELKSYSVFMLRMTPEKGKVHLYEYYNTSGEMGYTQTFLEKDNKLTELQYGRFRKQLTLYFEDYKELSKKIADKKFKKKEILNIIEEYNQWREYLWK